MMRKLAGPAAPRSRIFASSGSPTTVSFAITRTFFSLGSRPSETRCSTGTSPAAGPVPSRRPRPRAGGRRDPAEAPPPEPAGLLLGMRRDEDLVDRRFERRQRIADRRRRLGLDDVAVGRTPGVAQVPERALEAPVRRRPARVAVDDVAPLRLVHRRDDRDVEVVAAVRERVAQRLPVDGLVRDHQQVRHTGTSSISRAFEGARTACCAPGTPYSYGEPTTCGISSKWKVGGGEETCHSSVIARHGLAGAISPNRQLVIML